MESLNNLCFFWNKYIFVINGVFFQWPLDYMDSHEDIDWNPEEEEEHQQLEISDNQIREGDINHDLAQLNVREERARLRNNPFENVDNPIIMHRRLIGPPLSLERCRELCPSQFVTNTLFRPRDPNKQKDPK